MMMTADSSRRLDAVARIAKVVFDSNKLGVVDPIRS